MTKDKAMPDGTLRYLVAKWIASAIRLEKEAASAPSSVISKRGREARQIRASEMRTCANELDAALRVPEGQRVTKDKQQLIMLSLMIGGALGPEWDGKPLEEAVAELIRQARVPAGGPVEQLRAAIHALPRYVESDVVRRSSMQEYLDADAVDELLREGGYVPPASPLWQPIRQALSDAHWELFQTYGAAERIAPLLDRIEAAIALIPEAPPAAQGGE